MSSGKPQNGSNGTGGRVRRRVVTHMRKLLLQGAAGAAAGLGCTACDPVPPPPPTLVNCAALGSASSMLASADARWQPDSSGALVLQVSLYLYPPLTPSAAPSAAGATLSAVSTELLSRGNLLTFTAVPDPGVTAVVVSVPLQCEENSTTLQVTIHTTPVAGDHATVTLE